MADHCTTRLSTTSNNALAWETHTAHLLVIYKFAKTMDGQCHVTACFALYTTKCGKRFNALL